MKTFFSTACLATALLTLASCGSTKQSASAPTGVLEFDQATGSWKPATKIVAPPPHQASAPLPQVASSGTAEHHSSVWKKPLKWVGLAKEDPPLPPVPAAPAKTAKADTPPPPRSPIDPKPGARSLWQTIGDGIKAPFHAIGL